LPKQNDRRFELYFPSAEDLKRWKSIAEAAKTPLAKWIYATVEQHQAIKEAGLKTDLLKELANLKEEVQQLRGMARIKIIPVLQNLEGISENFVDVFVGGGSVALAVADTNPSTQIHMNDKDTRIAAFWKVTASDSVDELVDKLDIEPTWDLFTAKTKIVG
jgi:exopolyphosphatase/pppGpp-phosphohydrolase